MLFRMQSHKMGLRKTPHASRGVIAMMVTLIVIVGCEDTYATAVRSYRWSQKRYTLDKDRKGFYTTLGYLSFNGAYPEAYDDYALTKNLPRPHCPSGGTSKATTTATTTSWISAEVMMGVAGINPELLEVDIWRELAWRLVCKPPTEVLISLQCRKAKGEKLTDDEKNDYSVCQRLGIKSSDHPLNILQNPRQQTILSGEVEKVTMVAFYVGVSDREDVSLVEEKIREAIEDEDSQLKKAYLMKTLVDMNVSTRQTHSTMSPVWIIVGLVSTIILLINVILLKMRTKTPSAVLDEPAPCSLYSMRGMSSEAMKDCSGCSTAPVEAWSHRADVPESFCLDGSMALDRAPSELCKSQRSHGTSSFQRGAGDKRNWAARSSQTSMGSSGFSGSSLVQVMSSEKISRGKAGQKPVVANTRQIKYQVGALGWGGVSEDCNGRVGVQWVPLGGAETSPWQGPSDFVTPISPPPGAQREAQEMKAEVPDGDNERVGNP